MYTTAVETEGERLHAKAGINPERSNVRALSRALLGTEPGYAPMRPAAVLARAFGRWRIWVREGTPPPRARWLVGHELAHYHYLRRDHRMSLAALERRCDTLGAVLLAPRARVLRLGARHHRELAQSLGVTESLALLRLAEVYGTPTALVLPTRCIVRGHLCGDGCPPWRRVACPHSPTTRRRIVDEPLRFGLQRTVDCERCDGRVCRCAHR